MTIAQSVFGDNEATFKEILAEYIAPARAIVKDIEDAYNDQKAEDIGEAAHKPKSPSRSVGANTLADLCQKLEAAGESGDCDGIEARYPELDGLWRAVEEYIEAL